MLWVEGIATRTHNVAQVLSVVPTIAKEIFQLLEVTGIAPLTVAKVCIQLRLSKLGVKF